MRSVPAVAAITVLALLTMALPGASAAAPAGATWTYEVREGSFMGAPVGGTIKVSQIDDDTIHYRFSTRTFGSSYYVDNIQLRTLVFEGQTIVQLTTSSGVQEGGRAAIMDHVEVAFDPPVPLMGPWGEDVTESIKQWRSGPEGDANIRHSNRVVPHTVAPDDGWSRWTRGETITSFQFGANWVTAERAGTGLMELVSTNTGPAQCSGPDSDADGTPDACDLDRDGDGVWNDVDKFPDNPEESRDTDGDGRGDGADADDDGDGIVDVQDADDDGDGVLDDDDVCPGNDMADLDGDGVPDECDGDQDGDGVGDFADSNPRDPAVGRDLDGDGVPDEEDNDRDGDGLLDQDEGLYRTDPEDPDTDGDGLGDYEEVRVYGTNPFQADTDGDGVSDGDEVAAGTDPGGDPPAQGDGAPTWLWIAAGMAAVGAVLIAVRVLPRRPGQQE